MASITKKLVAVGDPGCGKTSLLTVIWMDKFPDEDLHHTFEKEVIDVVMVGGTKVSLSLCNTAGEKSGRVTRLHDGEVICACLYSSV